MSDKLFVRRRILAFLMVFLLVFSAIILLPAFSVDAETEEEYAVASSGEISNEVALASGLSNIPTQYLNKCIELTDSDEFEYAWDGKSTSSIKDYPGIYNNLYATAGNGPYVLNRDYSYSLADRNYDDPIGEIVPIELMQKIGVYTYFGKEYGFFINTYKSPHSIDKNIHSLVFVFDITYSMRRGQDGNPDGCVTVNVEPVFQYRYVYLDSNNSSFRMYDYYDSDDYANVFYSINKNVIRPHPKYSNGERSFDYQDIFYLKDVSVGMTLFNEQALNPNDKGYSYENDNGAFFIMAENEYSGRVLKDGKLTTDDKLDVASHVLGSVLDVVAFGANIIAPGSGTLIEILDVAGGLIDVADGARLWTNVSQSKDIKVECYAKKATFNCLYANKIEQINNYGGKTVKSMAVTNNSDNNNSIWYGQGDHYKAYFGINAEIGSGEQFPNTRAIVECALKIVDKKGNVYGAQNAVNKTVDNETYQESIDFAVSEDIYLLPNGYNCFSFVPYYSGKYIFNFDFSDRIKIELNGNEINGNSIYIDGRAGNEPIKIKIKNSGNAAQGKLLIDVSSISQAIDLQPNKETIVKVNNQSNGFYKLLTSKSNIIITQRCVVENGLGVKETFKGSSEVYTYLDKNSYLIIKNTSGAAVSGFVSINDVSTLEIDTETGCFVDANSSAFVKFVADVNTDYWFYVKSRNSVFINIYDINGRMISSGIEGNSFASKVTFNSGNNREIIIKLFVTENVSASPQILICKSNVQVKWYVDGVEVPDRVAEIERGRTVTMRATLNNKEISSFSGETSRDGVSLEGNKVTVESNAVIGGYLMIYLSVLSGFGLKIVPKFEEKLNLSLDDSFLFSYSGGTRIHSFNYTLLITDGYKNNKLESSQVIQSDAYSVLNGKINFNSRVLAALGTTYGFGWEDVSVDIMVKIEKIYVYVWDPIAKKDIKTEYLSDLHCTNGYEFLTNGRGIESDPYLISTVKEFNNLKYLDTSDMYFRQTADIGFGLQLPSTIYSMFFGIYDGNGKSITFSYRFLEKSTLEDMGGLFLLNTGTISNLTVNGTINNLLVANKNNSCSLGGVVCNNFGTIKNIKYNAYIYSCAYITGGLVASNSGIIEGCTVTGQINVRSDRDISYTGGLVGDNHDSIKSSSTKGLTVSYTGAESSSRTLAPRIGAIVGVWTKGTILPTGYGTVNKGTLKTVTWWEGLKKKSHNQAQYVGTVQGESKV